MRATLILVVMTGCCVLLVRSVTAGGCSGKYAPSSAGCGCAGSCPDPTCGPASASGSDSILAEAKAKLIADVDVKIKTCLGIDADITLDVTAYVDCILQCDGILDNCQAQLTTALTATLKINLSTLLGEVLNPEELVSCVLQLLSNVNNDVQVSVYATFTLYINKLCVCELLELPPV
jgi:hypothetical protein